MYVGLFLLQEDDYPVIISMDGNFGLVRKKSSGVSFSQPKHAGHFFTNQSGVDEFVQKHNGNMKKAGNVRSCYHMYSPPFLQHFELCEN